jgi:hypothetical protein
MLLNSGRIRAKKAFAIGNNMSGDLFVESAPSGPEPIPDPQKN